MKQKQLLSQTRKAIDDYKMINEGDKIAVGLSGGKDSLTLLYALKQLQSFYPNHFQLMAITVDLGFDNFNVDAMKQFCTELGVPYQVIVTQIAPILFETRKESHPCSLCSKMRKGALNQALAEKRFNKVAYAHHRDDLIETMLLSLLFEGRFHTFEPKTLLERREITVIRPLLYVTEADIKGFCNRYQMPVLKSPCPMDGHTKREYVKNLIRQLTKENPGVKEQLFHAALELTQQPR